MRNRRRAVITALVASGWALVWGCDAEESNDAVRRSGDAAAPTPTTTQSGSSSGAPPSGTDAASNPGDGSLLAPADSGVTDAKKEAEASSPPPPPNPCEGVVCPAGQACVSEAHGQPLGVCVDTCDCSNCGNCAYDNTDGRWNDQQEYCGNLKASPATVVCNKPCTAAGHGCIYYGAVNICWPLEGCFSK